MVRKHQQRLRTFGDLSRSQPDVDEGETIIDPPAREVAARPVLHIEHEQPLVGTRLELVAGSDEARAWFGNNVKLGYTQIFMTQRVMTVALARLLLDVNPANRRVIRSAVDEFVNAMQNGKFESLNGESIIISREGLLNNGQNRATAVLESGIEQEFLFVFGVLRETRKTLDQNRRRNANDYLSMEGVNVAKYVSGVAMLHWMWNKHGNLNNISSSIRPGASQIAEYALEHIEELSASVHFVPRRGANLVGGIPVLAFAHWLFTQHDTIAGNNFISQLVEGTGLEDGSPILRVRERLMAGRHLARADKLELIIRAWNAHREGRQPKQIPVTKRLPEISG